MSSIQTLRVLTYHRVMEPRLATSCDPTLISATPSGFDAQMRHLAKRYRVVSADEVADAWAGGEPLPQKAVLITFDDATRDFADVAWPILRKWKLPATVFVPTAYPGRRYRAFWWDRLYCAVASTTLCVINAGPLGLARLDSAAARGTFLKRAQRFIKNVPHGDAMEMVDRLCRDLGERKPPEGDVLSLSALRRLAAEGVSLGGHTHTHPALTQLSVSEAAEQIRRSRDELVEHTGYMPRVFAYPFGDHNDAVVDLVREAGFAIAVTCLDGHNRVGDDPCRLRRTNITPRSTTGIFKLRLTGLGAKIDQWRHGVGSAKKRVVGPLAPPLDTAVAHPGLKVGYMMSRFPKVSETFVLNEMLAVEAQGVPVEVYPLIRERQTTMHPEVAQWVERARFRKVVSLPVLQAHAHFLKHQPKAYLSLGVEVLWKTLRSRNLFVGALGTFPKAVCFARDMQRDGVTHVHAHFATHPALGAFIINKLTGIPYSFTAHGSDLHVDRTMLDTKVEAAAFAVTISEFNKNVIVGECGDRVRSKVHVVHCGVNDEFFATRASSQKSGPAHIVCVASLEEVKGHRFLLDACRKLVDRGIDVRCDLVGEGPMRASVEKLVADLGLSERVQLLGAQPRPAVKALLSQADVAVLASHPTKEGKREGIPVALMEAMASGLPVVSTSISGIPELVESGVSGLLVPSGDAAALADALAALCADPGLRVRMGEAGRQKVQQDFNLESNALRLVQLFSGSATPRPSIRVGSQLAPVAGRMAPADAS
ncbi:MAG: glycosyltransferase [Vicinamibacterales bacterium]